MNKKIFSLVVATINRKKEVEEFLESIKSGKFPLDKIEVILVDQNKKIDLKEIVEKYKAFFDLIYIRSEEKGLSKNRNKGFEKASGDIVAFPDDDCKYSEDTLIKVFENFKNNPNLDAVIGRIIDEEGEDCIRKWGRKFEKVTPSNFYSKMSSITLFKKNKNKIKFDEELGAGAKFGSSEDADLLYKMIKNRDNVVYDPEVILFHPKGFNNFDEKKAYSYGVGHGVFCRRNLDAHILKIYFMGVGLVVFRIIKSILTFDKINLKIWWNSLKGRIDGIKNR